MIRDTTRPYKTQILLGLYNQVHVLINYLYKGLKIRKKKLLKKNKKGIGKG